MLNVINVLYVTRKRRWVVRETGHLENPDEVLFLEIVFVRLMYRILITICDFVVDFSYT